MPTRITLVHGVGGGMERWGQTIVDELARRDHVVTVVTTAHPGGREGDRDGGVETRYLPASTWRRYQPRWWEAAWAEVRARHAAEPFDAVLSQSAGGLGWLARARAELDLPAVVLLHGSARSELTAAWHGATNPRGAYRLGRQLWRQPRIVSRWLGAAGAVAHWIAVSPRVAADNQRELHLPPDRLTVVRPGVDTARFRPDPAAATETRRRLGIPPSAFVVAVATRLERGKGVDVPIDALAGLPPHAELVIAGTGREEAALRRQAAGRPVRFLGRVDHGDLPAVLAAADAFVLPTRLPEGLPVSLVEAMACGLPVVASDVPGARAVVTDGVDGLLVPPGDRAALARALAVLAGDMGHGHGRDLGARARAKVEAALSAPIQVGAIEAVLTDVVRRSRC